MALSRDTAGKDLTEMMDLHAAGALAFTDGPGRPANGSLLRRGLEYAKAFGGILLNTPYDTELAEDGQIHEGATSVRLGLRGIPVLCETVPLHRDLSVLAYTGGRLLLHLLSSAAGLAMVRDYQADGEGLVGATVSAHHLTFTDEDLDGFDPNFKMLPPLRGRDDREALREGVLDGTIEAIVSHHRARHGEEKDLEFTYSAFGALGLETALRQLLPWLDTADKLGRGIAALTSGPRRLLGLPATADRGRRRGGTHPVHHLGRWSIHPPRNSGGRPATAPYSTVTCPGASSARSSTTAYGHQRSRPPIQRGRIPAGTDRLDPARDAGQRLLV